MSDRPIIVLASIGRSGSTLMQRVLNSNEKLVIWGENDSVVNCLAIALRHLKIRMDRGGDLQRDRFFQGMRNFWTSDMVPPIEDVLSAWRKMLIGLYSSGGKRWGFKGVDSGEELVGLMDRVFPGVRYVFLVRNPLDAVQSFMSHEYTKSVASAATRAQDWSIRSEFFRAYTLAHPDRALLVRYEDLTLEKCVEIFCHVGETPDLGRISEVLGNEVGGWPLKPLCDSDRNEVLNYCLPGMKTFGYTS